MSTTLANSKESSMKSDEMMRQIGNLRRTNALLTQLLLFTVLWLGLAVGAVVSFVTPESFEAWREGIAIQLIRRSPQTSLMGLQLRRTFGYLCERSFFEVPNTMLVALRSPIQLALGGILALPLAAALRAGALSRSRHLDDVVLAGSVMFIANVLFLGDDLGLSLAPQMAKLGGFLLMTSLAVLALPSLIRTVYKPRPWSTYKTQILRRLRDEETIEQPTDEVATRVPTSVANRTWTAFAASQVRRRHSASSREIAVVLLANTVVYAIDTLIAHD